MKSQIGVDFGATHTRVAVFGDDPTAWETVARFKTQPSYEAQLQRLIDALKPLEPTSVGLAVGAQLDPDGKTIAVSYTMPHMVGRPIVQDLSAALACPVDAANDNVCAVIAEHGHGALRGEERSAYLTVSTGTGAGVRLEQSGVVLAFLSQVGHHMIDPSGHACACGQIGCLQAATGGQHLERALGRSVAEETDEAFWRAFTRTLATGVVNLARVTRVEAVVVGGSIGVKNAYLRGHLSGVVAALSPGLALKVLPPAFAEASPLVGAGLLADAAKVQSILH